MLFLAQCAVMTGFSWLVYRTLFSGRLQSLHLVMLVGLVLGVLFRSLSDLMQRIMAPNDFIVLQDRLFANFNTVNSDVLLIQALAVLAVTLTGVRSLSPFDVLALGRDTAISLGVDYKKTVTLILILVAVAGVGRDGAGGTSDVLRSPRRHPRLSVFPFCGRTITSRRGSRSGTSSRSAVIPIRRGGSPRRIARSSPTPSAISASTILPIASSTRSRAAAAAQSREVAADPTS